MYNFKNYFLHFTNRFLFPVSSLHDSEDIHFVSRTTVDNKFF